MEKKAPTEKQVNKLIYEFKRSQSVSIQKIWQRVPKNSTRYPDTRANYRQAIFADWLKAKATSRQVGYLIELVNRGYMAGKIKSILRHINKQ